MAACDVCNTTLGREDGYLLHGRLVAEANYVAEVTKRNAAAFGVSQAEMQANLMAKARADTTPWMACNACIANFFGTEEEKAAARALAKRHLRGEKVRLDVLRRRVHSLRARNNQSGRPRLWCAARAESRSTTTIPLPFVHTVWHQTQDG